eukprot:95327_1
MNYLAGNGFFGQTQQAPHPRIILAEIIKFLRANRGPKTVQDIYAHVLINGTYRPNLHQNQLAAQSLRQNQHVEFDATKHSFAFKPTVPGLSSRQDLLILLSRSQDGLFEETLLDAYVGVEKDLEALKENKVIIHLVNVDTKKTVLFPRFRSLAKLKVDDDIRELWKSVEIPSTDSQHTMIQELEKSGHSVKDLNSRVRARPSSSKSKKKRKKRKMRINLTNVHLKGKFDVYGKIGK